MMHCLSRAAFDLERKEKSQTMKTSKKKVAGKRISDWEKLSSELDEEMSGAPENTDALSEEEMKWFRIAALEAGPKVKITIRLRQWQIERAKELAKRRGIGYQTVLDEVISKGLLPH